MKPFNIVSKELFTRFQTENMDPALSLIGDGLSKAGLRNQFCARLIGFRSYEAIPFSDEPSKDETPMHFSFDADYSKTESVILDEPHFEIPDFDDSPYPECADYLYESKPINITLKSTPLLLSLLPVLLDDRTEWHPHSMDLGDLSIETGVDNLRRDPERSQIETLSMISSRIDGITLPPYAGLLESVKLLSDTRSVPEEMMGFNSKKDAFWINEHMKLSLEQLNAQVKAAFDAHLSRIALIEENGLNRFTMRDIANGNCP